MNGGYYSPMVRAHLEAELGFGNVPFAVTILTCDREVQLTRDQNEHEEDFVRRWGATIEQRRKLGAYLVAVGTRLIQPDWSEVQKT
jgi:hypothetical protein